MARCRMDFDRGDLGKNLSNLSKRIDRGVELIVERNADWGQTWLRTNAPWTDRTGAARSGMFTFAEHAGGHHEILMTYSVHYGIWLEIANSGKYQVIIPGMRVIGDHLMSDLRQLLAKI